MALSKGTCLHALSPSHRALTSRNRRQCKAILSPLAIANARVARPFVVIFADDTGHDYVRDAHGKIATAHFVKERRVRDAGHELANIDYTAEDERHFVALTKSGKEDGWSKGQ